MVYVRNCHASLSWLRSSGISGGAPLLPPNRLCMLTDRVTAKMTAVACPNPDVIYGFGILDLSESPVILQVPDFGDRFWLFQLGDQRTDGFAQMGKMYGTEPGFYLIAGPNWRGVAPSGVTAVLRCPTTIGYVLPRILVSDEPADAARLDEAINQIMVYPVDQFAAASNRAIGPRAAGCRTWPARSRGRVMPERFFEVLSEVLDTVPPLPGEEPLYSYFRELLRRAANDDRVRILSAKPPWRPNVSWSSRCSNSDAWANRQSIIGQPRARGPLSAQITLSRTSVAKSNILSISRPRRPTYQDLDSQGQRLSGDSGYRIRSRPGNYRPPRATGR